jgi:hypothetical protein
MKYRRRCSAVGLRAGRRRTAACRAAAWRRDAAPPGPARRPGRARAPGDSEDLLWSRSVSRRAGRHRVGGAGQRGGAGRGRRRQPARTSPPHPTPGRGDGRRPQRVLNRVPWIQRLGSAEPAHCSCCFGDRLRRRPGRQTHTRMGAELDCRDSPEPASMLNCSTARVSHAPESSSDAARPGEMRSGRCPARENKPIASHDFRLAAPMAGFVLGLHSTLRAHSGSRRLCQSRSLYTLGSDRRRRIKHDLKRRVRFDRSTSVGMCVSISEMGVIRSYSPRSL